ncbi:MAG: transketolase [bacterium]|nr:transketolase [bacterium]
MPITDDEIRQLEERARQIRRDIVDVTSWSGGSHIGGALSQADLLTALYYKYLTIDPERPDWDERDRCILSKGHGGVGWAVVLANRGYYPLDRLRDFGKAGSAFGMHLDGNKVPGVDASTGSLGHGLPLAVGMALGARTQGKTWRTYCICGDGECNEGSIWEAAMAAAHYNIDNLTAFVDRNRMMIDGLTEDVMSLEPFPDKWKAFGWNVLDIDGHDFRQIADAIDAAHAHKGAPTMIVAQTVKGKGVSFMEDDPAWHYGGLNADLAEKAKASLGGE